MATELAIEATQIVDAEGRIWLRIPETWRAAAELCGMTRDVGAAVPYRWYCRERASWGVIGNHHLGLCGQCMARLLEVK
ncbi:MAG: hypothetical protein ACRDGF_04120 [Chloroflexota bacterium]